MDTRTIPIGIKSYMTVMRRVFKGCDVYLSGGALAPHKTNDYDIVVISKYYSDRILEPMKKLYDVGMFDSIECYEAYGDTEEDDNKFHTKIVCDVSGTKVDFLFAMGSDYDIMSLMDNYPLSIQMQAVDFNGNLIQGERFCDYKIVVYQRGSSEEKYRKYYPNKEFIYHEDT